MVFATVWCVIAVLGAKLLETPWENLNGELYNMKMGWVAHPDPSPEIVHLDIDDAAIEQYGKWPWSRGMSARIVNRLEEFGARLTVFDIFYAAKNTNDPEGDRAFFEAIKRSGDVVSSFVPSISLVEPTVQEIQENSDPARADDIYDFWAWDLFVPSRLDLFHINAVPAARTALPPIIRGSRSGGHIKGMPGSDGVHRSVPMLVQYVDRCVPSLSLAALIAYWDVPPGKLSLGSDGTLTIPRDSGAFELPLDDHGMLVVNWAEPWSFRRYSVRDLLSDVPDRARESRYRGKIVIVAATFTGSTDFGTTPVDPHYPLSRIHSNSLNTIFKERFIWRIQPFPLVVVVAVLVSLVYAWVAVDIRLRFGVGIGIGIWLAALLGSIAAFVWLSCDIPVVEFYSIFVPVALAALVVRTVTFELEAARTSRAMERYLSPDLVEMVVTGEGELDLSTKRQELTVVFIDIVGFSTISETVQVEYINRFLNEFFETMTQCVFKYHGTVDKFLGDGMLVFFGDPLPLENHAIAAIDCAREMQKQMIDLNLRWAASGILEFQQGIRIRIGMNTGVVIVGNIGSNRRMEYTVLGSAVNIASRLQSQAHPGGIVFSSRTKAATRTEIECEGPEFVRVKGIDRNIEIYRIDHVATESPSGQFDTQAHHIP